MHASLDESVPSRKRRRSSKKKRLRKKKRASLEAKVKTEGDEIRHDEHEKYLIQDQTDDSDQEPSEKEQYTTQNPILTSQDCNQEHNTQVQPKVEEHDQDSSDEDDDEVIDYERKRRENILRNQAYLKSVGMSTAKFAARTSIGYEAEKEAKQELLAEKRALRAAEEKMPQQTEIVSQNQDSSGDDDSEMMDYERKRRENILRNQAYLKSVGMSTAKFAARTSIGYEVGAKKQLLAEKQTLRAADEKMPQRTEDEEEDQSSSDESVEYEHKRRSSRIQKKTTDLGRSRLRAHLRRDMVPDLIQQID